MREIKAVIFDMDGVLIDAKDWHYEALNKALKPFGMGISRYDHLITYNGLPTRKKLEMLSLEQGLPSKLHNLINDLKQQYTMELAYTRCKPVFYHEYALSKLHDEGYRLVVCSNSVRKSIETMVTKANLIQYLDFYLSNQDVSEPKPSPDIYITAIERLGLKPDECLIVEDNEKGVKAALSSGAHLLQVNDVEDVNYLNIINRIREIEDETNVEYLNANRSKVNVF